MVCVPVLVRDLQRLSGFEQLDARVKVVYRARGILCSNGILGELTDSCELCVSGADLVAGGVAGEDPEAETGMHDPLTKCR